MVSHRKQVRGPGKLLEYEGGAYRRDYTKEFFWLTLQVMFYFLADTTHYVVPQAKPLGLTIKQFSELRRQPHGTGVNLTTIVISRSLARYCIESKLSLLTMRGETK